MTSVSGMPRDCGMGTIPVDQFQAVEVPLDPAPAAQRGLGLPSRALSRAALAWTRSVSMSVVVSGALR